MKKSLMLLAVVILSGCVANARDQWTRPNTSSIQRNVEWDHCNQVSNAYPAFRSTPDEHNIKLFDECMVKKGFTKKGETGSTIVTTGDRGEDKVRVKEYGIVTINSIPEKADIFLDNALIGITPAAQLKLEAGDHVLEIRKPGYRLWKNSIKVLLNSETTINAELEK